MPNDARSSMIIEGGVFAQREAQLDSIRKVTDLEKLRAMTMLLFRDLEESRYESQDLGQTLSHIRAQLADTKLRAESAEAEKSELESKVQHLTVRLEQALKSTDPGAKSAASGADNAKVSPAPRMAMTSSRVSQIGPFNSASVDSAPKRPTTPTLGDSSASNTSFGGSTIKANGYAGNTGSLRSGKAASGPIDSTSASLSSDDRLNKDTPSNTQESTNSTLASSSDATPADAISKRSDSTQDASKDGKSKDKRGKKGSKDKTKPGSNSATTSPRENRSASISPRAEAPFQSNSSGDDKADINDSTAVARQGRPGEDDSNTISADSLAERKSNPFKRSSKSNAAPGETIAEETSEAVHGAGLGATAGEAYISPPGSPNGSRTKSASKDPFKSKPAPEMANFIASDTEGLSRSPVSNPRLAIWNGPTEKKRDRKRTGIDTFGSAEEPSGDSSPGRSTNSDPAPKPFATKPPMIRAGSEMSTVASLGLEPDSIARRRTSSSSASGDYSAFGSKETKKHKKEKSGKTGAKVRGGVFADDIQTDVEGAGRNYRRGASGDMSGVMSIVDPAAAAKRRPSGGATHHHATAGSNRLSMGPTSGAYNAYHRHMSQEAILSDHEGTYHSEKTEAKFRAVEARRQAQQARESIYGIAFGVRRGSCEAPCECKCYVKGTESYACGACSHFPAQHLDMGQVSDGEEDSQQAPRAHRSSALPADLQAGGVMRTSIGSSSDSGAVHGSGSGSDPNPPMPKAAGHSSDVVPSPAGIAGVDDDDAPSIDEHWRLNFSECFFISQLGKGNSSTVFLGEYQTENVAIKVLRQETHKRDLDDFKKEMEIMCSLRSPYIVHFYGATLTPKLCIVLEYCSRGTLFHYLHDDLNYVDWRLALRWLIESARGINTLHLWKPQIVHRDLKTLNLLLDDKMRIKVCDFGLSRYVSVEHDQSTFFKMRGTFAYFAPEVYQGKPFTSKSDVYSLGIILWEIVHRIILGSHTRPFAEYKHINHDFQIIIQAAKGLRPTLPFSTPRLLVKLYDDCVASDPDARPTCQEIIERLEHITSFYEEHSDTWDALVKGGVRLRPQNIPLRRRDSQGPVLPPPSGHEALTLSSSSAAASPNRNRAELLRTPIASRNLNADLTRRGITASMLREKSTSTSTTPLSGTSSPVLAVSNSPTPETPPGSTSTSAREDSSAKETSAAPVIASETSPVITASSDDLIVVVPPKSPSKARPGSPSTAKRKQKSGSDKDGEGSGHSSGGGATSPTGSPVPSKRASAKRVAKPINTSTATAKAPEAGGSPPSSRSDSGTE